MQCNRTVLVLAAVFCLVGQAALWGQSTSKPNVLFIAVDDLRPELNCYGRKHIHSPNIDRLAAQGMRFDRAYCMVPTCGASRASMMTGIRPTFNRFIHYKTWAEKDAAGIPTMNTHFKKNGYTTVSLGKVFHHTADSVSGWSESPWCPDKSIRYQRPENKATHQNRLKNRKVKQRGPAYESADAPDGAYRDGLIAKRAMEELQKLGKADKPFFLAVGFYKPHLPFVAPKKYWDLYAPATIKLPANYRKPKDAPDEALHGWGELRNYGGIPRKGPLDKATALKLIHGYYACVSFTDAQIGKVLGELKRLELDKNTIVVLWGDHGWNLGDHTLWCKHCCFESSMRIPLIVSVPGRKAGDTKALIESIDLYPTLCNLTKIPLPKHLEGKSFVPLLDKPDLPWKKAAIGRYRVGDTIRTQRYRFSSYTDRLGKKKVGRMLYDHQSDPLENTNIAGRPEEKPIVQELSNYLDKNKGR